MQALAVILGLTIALVAEGSVLPPSSQDFHKILADQQLIPFSDEVDLIDAKLSTPEIIVKYGYPLEIHHVTTEDGYILELHRIPYGKECGPAENKRVVWLQHGLLSDSSNYVLAGPSKALAYRMADACYDVWLGNARGNTYSKNHVSMPVEKDFWLFSWHEMGVYDLPANFDYILNTTGAEDLFYVGHSMGTTMFFVCMSERPEYNSKVRLMSALAPVAYTEHMISPIRLIAPFGSSVEWLLRMIGVYEFLPSNDFMDFIGLVFCREESIVSFICNNVFFLIMGYNVDQLDTALLPVILGHVPAGASVRSLVHFSQGVNHGQFLKYDFGKNKNQEVYGQDTPPAYDISKITAPVAVYWGENDWLAVKSDVYRLCENLPNLQIKYRIPHDRFNHADFLFAKDLNELHNNQVMKFMEYFW